MWVYNSTTESMQWRSVGYVPGLYKIFDEILVNAADNRHQDKNMNEVRVWVDREKGQISVRNNGKGIPIEMHDKEKMYIPEMIFGHLLTGSNYNDDEKKVVGGRNGYGAKLCNIFSTEFTIDTVDSRQGKKYRQTWQNNMSDMGQPKITAHKSEDYTMVTFSPDFAKFGMTEMDDDFEALVKRRVYDLAGTCAGIKVYLNDNRLKITKFKQYMEMYTKAIKEIKTEGLVDADMLTPPDTQVILTDNPHDRWEVGFAVSDGSFQQVSFVNSIATTFGGTHVNYIADQIVNRLADLLKKKNKGGVPLKSAQIRNHMFLFVNCQIENPAFASQTKESMTTKQSAFGSKCVLTDKFLKSIEKSGVMDNIMDFAAKKADQILKKSDGNRRTRMDNALLTDANKAGTKDGHRCTLILTEGNSAKPLAMVGRSVVSSDLFGVFPLRGKVLNVRDASVDQISKNAEIQNIKKFLGLQHKKEYTDTKGLRYGHLMIMTDQDHDGSHIKGLLINFLQCQFPSLLKIDGFLQEFITPIVRVWKGDDSEKKHQKNFYTMPEYETWKRLPGNDKGWRHKYYKGLGTSDPMTDGTKYFSDLDLHLKQFAPLKQEENQFIELAFSKKKADDRKLWLERFVPGTYLDMQKTEAISYDDFVNKELILYSMVDNQRSIPSVLDGLKPGQRKVLYTCLNKSNTNSEKVGELQGRVTSGTAYAYGDSSLQQTIIAMAQDYVGSNNINILQPDGNFGSRDMGGGDAASPRYIYTRIAPITRRIFHAADDALLKYNEDDGKSIEPVNYVPVLPMLLVNGADGIGTGWSTSIPNYDPDDIIENLRRRMKGTSKDDMLPMQPWFRGWTGTTQRLEDGKRYKFNGTLHLDESKCEVEVTELPIRVWTQDFKERVVELESSDKMPASIRDHVEYNTPTTVHFILKFTESKFKELSNKPGGFEDVLKMNKTMATTNLVAFDREGRMHRYESVIDIMEEFYHVRLDLYARRKTHLLDELNKKLQKLTNQARFIKMIIDNKLTVSKKKKDVLVSELDKLAFKRIPKATNMKRKADTDPEVGAEDADDNATGAGDFDYLLGMAIWSLTQERVDALLKLIGDQEEEINALAQQSPKDLWVADLDAVQQEWVDFQEGFAKRAAANRKAGKGRRASAKLGIGGASKKRRAGESDEDSDADFGPVKKKATSKPAVKKALTTEKPLSSWLDKPEKRSAGLYDADGNIIQSKSNVKPASATESLKVVNMVMKKEPLLKTESSIDKTSAKPKATVKAAPAKAKAKKVIDSDSDVVSDDDVGKIGTTKTSAAGVGGRQGRAAASKPKRYTAAASSGASEYDDDDLGDITNMVKGSTSAVPAARSLISASRPSSSASRPSVGHAIKSSAATAKAVIDIDDTDWDALAEGSPKKPKGLPVAGSDVMMLDAGDDQDDSLLLSTRKPAVKPVVKPAAKSAKAKITLTAAAKPMSPAAKAYAKKQAIAKALEDADDDVSVASPVPAKRVAVKKKYSIDSDEEMDEVDDEDEDTYPEESDVSDD